MKSRQAEQSVKDRWLEIEEIRLISDLRIMHSKVEELHHIVNTLRQRHDEAAIHKYADQPVLAEDIRQVDEIYMWFLNLKEKRERQPTPKRTLSLLV